MQYFGRGNPFKNWWLRGRTYREIMDAGPRFRTFVITNNVDGWMAEMAFAVGRMERLPNRMLWNFWRMGEPDIKKGPVDEGLESISLAAFQVLKRRDVLIIPDDAGNEVST